MKTFAGFFLGIIVTISSTLSIKAQDVYISIPATNIFNRSEFITVENILNTRNHENWRLGFFAPIWPEIRSTSGNYFSHRTKPGISLASDFLQWQVNGIGGQPAPFRSGDTWPMPYKWFTTSSQYWYQPSATNGGYNSGNVAFNFKVPSNKYLQQTFHAGEYVIGITHNYTSNSTYTIEFTPNNFNVILSIPAAISWLSNTPSKYIEINSLSNYRTSGTVILGDFGISEIGNTVDFNLLAKTNSSSIQFTSSKGVTGTRPIALLKLESTNPKVVSSSLSSNWKSYSSANNFKVMAGNRNNFPLQLSISETDLKNYFFEAGTYVFQLNLDAKSTDNSISSVQNTDVILKVLPLSEITIPSGGNEVNFNFNTSQQYEQGQSKIVTNQLKISNNETFELYVKSDATHFNKFGIQSDLPASTLQIGVDGNPENVTLSTTSQKIISNGVPVLDKNLNLKYNISPSAAQTLVSKEKTTYSINVIYSFTAL